MDGYLHPKKELTLMSLFSLQTMKSVEQSEWTSMKFHLSVTSRLHKFVYDLMIHVVLETCGVPASSNTRCHSSKRGTDQILRFSEMYVLWFIGNIIFKTNAKQKHFNQWAQTSGTWWRHHVSTDCFVAVTSCTSCFSISVYILGYLYT